MIMAPIMIMALIRGVFKVARHCAELLTHIIPINPPSGHIITSLTSLLKKLRLGNEVMVGMAGPRGLGWTGCILQLHRPVPYTSRVELSLGQNTQQTHPKGGSFILMHSLGLMSVWQQGHETVGHTVHTARKQREVNVGAQLMFLSVRDPKPMEWCHSCVGWAFLLQVTQYKDSLREF